MTAKTRKLKRKSKVRRRKDSIPLKYCVLTVICGLFLVAGFFYAARQHFSSMDYGMKNAKLRKQIDDLNAEKRRLQLSKEIALSPAEIKKAAQKMGFTAMTASNIEVVDSKSVSSDILEETDKSEDEKDSKVRDEKDDIPEIRMSKEIKDKVKKDIAKKEKKKEEKSKKSKTGKTKKSESKKNLDKKDKKSQTDKKSNTRKSRPQVARK